MSRTLKWTLSGAVFTMITGTLLHFAYEWFGGTFWSIIGAVNESTWEHLKLLFFPMVIFGVVEYLTYGKEYSNFIPVRILSILIGMASIVIIFYTYTGILGYNIAFIDIATFFVGVILAYWISYRLLITESPSLTSTATRTLFLAILVLLLIAFITWTFSPPKIALFLDPVSGQYGI